MFHNYFFLKRLAPELKEKLKGKLLLECFSQNKDELILGFADENDAFYIQATLDSRISLLLFAEDFKRAKKNSVSLFETVINTKVIDVMVFDFERSFQIILENDHSLIFKMHGSRSNILLTEGDKVKSLFRNNLSADLLIVPSALNKVAPSRSLFDKHDGNAKLALPALGKEINEWLEENGYSKMNLDQKWAFFNETIDTINTHPISVIDQANTAPRLSLLAIRAEETWKSQSAIASANKLYRSATKFIYLDHGKSSLLKELNKKINQSINYITKTQEKLESIRNSRSYEEIANIIMANLYLLEKKTVPIELDDFYSSGKITINRKPNISPQKQAEQLYRKSKNQKIEINNLESNIANKESILNDLLVRKETVENTDDFKDLRSVAKSEQKEQQEILPYHKYDYQGYEILVGKNAKSNDELTTRIAHKNDLWLHAKDVPGSHVIIRNSSANLPSDVLEFAAQLAAWFSKRKNDTLCPVIYTERKYVRKVKGAPAGAVRLERESVIMVNPNNPTTKKDHP